MKNNRFFINKLRSILLSLRFKKVKTNKMNPDKHKNARKSLARMLTTFNKKNKLI